MNWQRLGTLAGEYVANLLLVVLVWFTTVMALAGAGFADLVAEKALVALTMAIALWLIACLRRWQQTGALDPVPAAIAGQLMTTESHLRENVAAGILDAVRTLGWTPLQVLVPQPATSDDERFLDWHRGGAGRGPVGADAEPLPPDVPAPPPIGDDDVDGFRGGPPRWRTLPDPRASGAATAVADRPADVPAPPPPPGPTSY